MTKEQEEEIRRINRAARLNADPSRKGVTQARTLLSSTDRRNRVRKLLSIGAATTEALDAEGYNIIIWFEMYGFYETQFGHKISEVDFEKFIRERCKDEIFTFYNVPTPKNLLDQLPDDESRYLHRRTVYVIHIVDKEFLKEGRNG